MSRELLTGQYPLQSAREARPRLLVSSSNSGNQARHTPASRPRTVDKNGQENEYGFRTFIGNLPTLVPPNFWTTQPLLLLFLYSFVTMAVRVMLYPPLEFLSMQNLVSTSRAVDSGGDTGSYDAGA